ncbi:MAG: lysophospholipid acyltransferase family protein [Planctomycetota bacterium]
MLKSIWYFLARSGCRVLCSIFFKIRVYGLRNIPPKKTFILVSNNQSFLDPIFCGSHIKRRLYYPARDTLFKNRFFKYLFSSVNAIPVKRGKADFAAIKTIIAKLRQGHAVCLYPEATRTKDGKISEFKPGFGLLCKRSNAAVVPMVIDGAFECWPRHKKFFSLGSKITVHYGKCITSEQIKTLDAREVAENLTNIIRKMQNKCRIEKGKPAFDY